jgi:hypothetical protein
LKKLQNAKVLHMRTLRGTRENALKIVEDFKHMICHAFQYTEKNPDHYVVIMHKRDSSCSFCNRYEDYSRFFNDV